MADKNFKITMRENGEHSFKKAIDAYKTYNEDEDSLTLKDAVMFLHHAVELLMKEILILHNQYLIFEELKDLVRKQKDADKRGISIFSIDNPPRTVSYEVAIERVEALIKPAELDEPLLDSLKKLGKLRNKLEHHEIEADGQEVVDLLVAIHDPALRLFEAQLGKLEKLHTPQTEQVWKNIVRGEELAHYTNISAQRPTDGAQIVAQRLTVSTSTPIRWTIYMKDRLEHAIYDEHLPRYEDPMRKTLKQYRHSELLQQAAEIGFYDWKQSPRGMVEGTELINGEYQKRSFPAYPIPDPTDYPID